MIRGANTSAEGMLNQKAMHEVLADNLANASTTGYKSYKTIHQLKAQENTEIPAGSEAVDSSFNFAQGALRRTDNTFDIAISGDGFFGVMNAQGEIGYTRDGNFTVDEKGFLVTQFGDQVLDTSFAPIFVGIENTESFTVHVNGNIMVNNDYITTLRTFKFDEDSGIIKKANNKYVPAIEGELLAVSEDTMLRQGFLEQSNVSSIKSSTAMIQIQRDFQSNEKALKVQMDTMDMLMRISDLQ